MSLLKRVLTSPLTSLTLDLRVSQVVIFLAAPALGIVAFTQLARLPLSPTEFLLGILATLALTVLFVLLGILIPISEERIRSGTVAMRASQLTGCFAGVAVLLVAFPRLAALPVTPAQAILGLLLSLALSMALVGLGMALPLAFPRKRV